MNEFQLPLGFDGKKQNIMFAFIEEELNNFKNTKPRFIKIISVEDPFIKYDSLDDWIDAESPNLWLEKYGEVLPPDTFLYGTWADCLNPVVIPYDGLTKLSDEEQNTIYNFVNRAFIADLTMAMLYFMIEGLKWRPGSCCGNNSWPSVNELRTFYNYYQDDCPDSHLHIILCLLAASSDGDVSDSKLYEIRFLIEKIHPFFNKKTNSR